MPLPENMQPASFRGAGFQVGDDSGQFGRRTVKHTYPLQDLPYTEDMGRKPRSWRVRAFVVGDDYQAQRDAVIAACEEAGPGKLVHPFYGSLEVICTSCSVQEAFSRRRIAEFSLSFEEAGQRNFPTQQTDFTAQAAQAGQNTRTVAGDVFRQVYSSAGPAWLRAAAAGDVRAALQMVRAIAKIMPSPLGGPEVDAFLAKVDAATAAVDAALATDPNALAQVIEDTLGAAAELPPDAGAALAIEVAGFGAPKLSDYAPALGYIPPTTATRQKQAANRQAVISLVQRMAISTGVEAALAADYPSHQDAMAARDALLGRLDAAMLAAGEVDADDAAYQALRELYASAVEGFRQRGANLAHLQEYRTPPTGVPALVAAYDLYGDLSRADEIAARNRVRDPGLIPGGERLAVLDA